MINGFRKKERKNQVNPFLPFDIANLPTQQEAINKIISGKKYPKVSMFDLLV